MEVLSFDRASLMLLITSLALAASNVAGIIIEVKKKYALLLKINCSQTDPSISYLFLSSKFNRTDQSKPNSTSLNAVSNYSDSSFLNSNLSAVNFLLNFTLSNEKIYFKICALSIGSMILIARSFEILFISNFSGIKSNFSPAFNLGKTSLFRFLQNREFTKRV